MKVKHRLPILMAISGVKSLAELSRLTNIPKTQIVRFANYKAKFLDPELLAAVCKVLDCSIEQLLYIDGQAS